MRAEFVRSIVVLFIVGACSGETCEPIDQLPNWGQLEEFADCSLTKTWPELAQEEKRCFTRQLFEDNCTFVFKNGGLGDLMVDKEFYEWVCVLGDECATQQGESYFCYVYSESDSVFVPWNTNGALNLFNEEPCSDGWPAYFDLSGISAYGGFTILGPDSYNTQFGVAVSPAGDINGDGLPDMMISSDRVNQMTGAVWVVFGRDDVAYDSGEDVSIPVADLAAADGFVIHGEAKSDYLGSSVSYAGDVNGDGVDDIVLGAAGNDPQRRQKAGAAYVIFGRKGASFPAALSVTELDGSNGFTVQGEGSQDDLGTHVSGTGDVNGDGYDDVILGAWHYNSVGNGASAKGRAYVVFGGASFPAALDLQDLAPDQGFTITSYTSLIRLDNGAVGWAGDVDGDGLADVLVGSQVAGDAGEAFLIYGSPDGYPNGVDVGALGTAGFRMVGVSGSESNTGHSVSGAGDVNGDGLGDVLVGAHEKHSDGKSTAGEVYVVYGSSERRSGTFELESLETGDGSDGCVIKGEEAGDRAGWAVGTAGDFNGDGVGDVVIGAYKGNGGQGQGEGGGSDYGSAYVVFGRQGGLGAEFRLEDVDGVNGFKAHGWDASGKAGYAVMGGMDINGDGYDDVLVGAPDQANMDGAAYVLLGKPNKCNETSSVDDDDDDEDEDGGMITCDATKTLKEWDTCTLPSYGCCGEGLTCYVQNTFYHQCLATGSCDDPSRKHWECTEFVGHDAVCATGDGTLDEWDACTDNPTGCKTCNVYGQQLACYKQDEHYSQCLVVDSCPPKDDKGWDCSATFNDGR